MVGTIGLRRIETLTWKRLFKSSSIIPINPSRFSAHILRVLLGNQGRIERIAFSTQGGHAIALRDDNLFPRSHLPFPRSRNGHLFVALPPAISTSDPSFFMYSSGRVIQTNWKVFRAPRVRASPPCVSASPRLSIMVMRCRFHSAGWKKKRPGADGRLSFATFYPACSNFISASAEPRFRADVSMLMLLAKRASGLTTFLLSQLKPSADYYLYKFKHPIALSLQPDARLQKDARQPPQREHSSKFLRFFQSWLQSRKYASFNKETRTPKRDDIMKNYRGWNYYYLIVEKS